MTDYTTAQAAIVGALVADAASLGFHWLYDQQRIRDIATEFPEFHQHTLKDYEGVPGYYAHANRHKGDLSQYGEQALLMLNTLAANNGTYEKAQFQTAFRDHFGYGGDYVGYIDHATRDTLDNIAATEKLAGERINALPFTADDAVKRRLSTKLTTLAKTASGVALREQLEGAVRISDDNDELVAHAMLMADEWERISGYPGADDRQHPAIAKLPALVSLYTQSPALHEVVESAVKVTNNNSMAISFGHSTADMLASAMQNRDVEQAVLAGKQHGDKLASKLIDDAQSMSDKSTNDATAHFGMACDLDFGVPSIAHNLFNSANYTAAIRNNIYAGGDNCGRSIMLGAIAGACYGVGGDTGIPEAWIAQLNKRDEIHRLLAATHC